MKNKICVIFNTCGISGRDNSDYYLMAIESLLEQDFKDIQIILSDCKSPQRIREKVMNHLGNKISYNFIDDVVPISISCNHSCKLMVKQFGEFESFLYVDSGVHTEMDTNVISKMYNVFKNSDYAIVSARVNNDFGDEWGVSVSNTTVSIVPLGKCIHLHFQLFSKEFFDVFGGILPDILAAHAVECMYAIFCAAINKKWAIIPQPILHHHHGLDVGNSGFVASSDKANPALFKCPKSMPQICAEGRPLGFGFEELFGVCRHDPSLFDENRYAKNPELKTFLKNNLFLSKESFDYDNINHTFIPIGSNNMKLAFDMDDAKGQLNKTIKKTDQQVSELSEISNRLKELRRYLDDSKFAEEFKKIFRLTYE